MTDLSNRISNRLDDRIPARFDNWADRAAYLLAEYKLGIYLAIFAAVGLIATDRAAINIPDPVQVALIGFAVGIIPAIAVGFRLADRWLPDPRIRVIELDPDGPTIEPKRVPRDLWEDREIESMPVWSIKKGSTDAIVTKIEHLEGPDTLKVRGVNPELADPISIAARNEKLETVFGELLDDRRELEALKATEGMRQIEIEKRIINELVRSVEKGTSINPGAFDEIIEDATEDLHIDPDQVEPDMDPIDSDPVPEQADSYGD